jgi:penicillin-binding protein 1C
LNIPAVHALNSIGGPETLQRRLTDFGFITLERSPAEYGLGLTLGHAEERLIDLTHAYAALARMGEFRPWRVFTDDAPRSGRLVGDPRACWLIADILSDNAARVPSFGVESALRFEFPVACKTGTSTDYRDNWALGYTPEFTVGVWTGNFNGTAMQNVSGVTGAAPVMHAVMEHLHARSGTTWFATPPEVMEYDIHPLTGKRLTSPRKGQRREKFLAEHLPPVESPADYDASGAAKLGPEFAEWLEQSSNAIGDGATVDAAGTLRIISPIPGTTFVIDPDLPGSRRVRLQATGGSNIEWQSNSLDCREGEALLAEGEHRLVAVDKATGVHVETWIKVKSL